MRRLAAHAKVTVLIALLLVLGAGAWSLTARHSSAQADPAGQNDPGQADPGKDQQVMTEAQREAFLGALAEMALDRQSLAALNLSGAQAAAILEAGLGWFAQHATELAAADNRVNAQRAAVRVAEKAVRLGAGDGLDQPLAQAQAALAHARAARKAVLNGLGIAIGAELSPSQRETWVTIQAGWGQEQPIRMLAFTTAQRHSYAESLRIHQLKGAAASTAEEMQAVAASWQAALAQILTADNQRVIDAYNDYVADSGAALDSALDQAMGGGTES
jgi:hypothetical protein